MKKTLTPLIIVLALAIVLVSILYKPISRVIGIAEDVVDKIDMIPGDMVLVGLVSWLDSAAEEIGVEPEIVDGKEYWNIEQLMELIDRQGAA